MLRRFALVLLLGLTVFAPATVQAQTGAELIAADVDAFWAAQFAERGLVYTSPRFKIVTEPGTDFCDFIDTYSTPAGYCASSQTVTISTGWVSPEDIATILPMISHEWGHHIQWLVDTGVTSPMEAEQQADCFAGAFVAYARDADWINPVVAAIALQVTQSAGDIAWDVAPEEAIHGNQGDRALAFLTGLNGGLAACGF